MRRFEKTIRKNLQGTKVLLLFITTTCNYLIMVLMTIPKVMSYGSGMRLLDMMPTGYDLEYVNTLFGALGQEGREAYLQKQIPFDMIYPGLFAITYSLILAYFLKKMDKLKRPFVYFCILPIIIGLMDYAENFGIISILTTYPEISSRAVAITGSFSLLKSMGTTVYFLILITVLIVLGVRFLGKKTTSAML